jgi:hypothetical protein
MAVDEAVRENRGLRRDRWIELGVAEPLVRPRERGRDDPFAARFKRRWRQPRIANLARDVARSIDDLSRRPEVETLRQALSRRKASACLIAARRPAARGSKAEETPAGAKPLTTVLQEARTRTCARLAAGTKLAK